VSPASLTAMQTGWPSYGLHLAKAEYGGLSGWGHNGTTAGFSGEFAYFPATDICLVLLTNDFDTKLIEPVFGAAIAALQRR
jgi:D-alanyl-D-alanine carboxypeptidase